MEFMQLVYILLIMFAIYSVFAKNLKRAIAGAGIFGLWVSIIYIFYHAPDVALAEAVISSSLATILLVVTIKNYNDIGTKHSKLQLKQVGAYTVAFVSMVLVIYLTHFAAPFSESTIGLMVMDSFFANDRQVNPVTGIVLNHRVFDTIFEALLLLISSVGVVHLVNSAKAKEKAKIEPDDPWHVLPDFGNASKFCHITQKFLPLTPMTSAEPTVTLRHKKHPSAVLTITFILPVLILISLYLIVSDPINPGGGFQGGALLSAAFVSHYLIMPDHPVSTKFLNSIEKLLFLALVSVIAVYVLMGVKALLPGAYLAYFILTDALLGVKVFCGLSIMFLSFAREHNKV